MPYKIADNEIRGRYFADEAIFNTKQDIIDQLASFHDVDFEGVDDNDNEYESIYAFLDTIKDDEMKLNFLLDHGNWSLEEVKDINEIINDIEEAIEFEDGKDLSKEWTKDYKEGFVDGLKRALEIIKE